MATIRHRQIIPGPLLTRALLILAGVALLTPGFSMPKNPHSENDSTLKVLVLIPYDEIANAGVSPDIQKIIESALQGKPGISIIPFPWKKLMNVPYQMVFDKRYCKPITEKISCDIIIMSQIITNNERKPGRWTWTYKIRVFNVKTNTQFDSISGKDLQAEDFAADINKKLSSLLRDIDKVRNKLKGQ